MAPETISPAVGSARVGKGFLHKQGEFRQDMPIFVLFHSRLGVINMTLAFLLIIFRSQGVLRVPLILSESIHLAHISPHIIIHNVYHKKPAKTVYVLKFYIFTIQTQSACDVTRFLHGNEKTILLHWLAITDTKLQMVMCRFLLLLSATIYIAIYLGHGGGGFKAGNVRFLHKVYVVPITAHIHIVKLNLARNNINKDVISIRLDLAF